ncbi:hydroxymethylglutaryl-CoA synthase [Vagococcus humatus]|uniref:Hydroxymethylglutaryl-CoA synthase n=1 Tax=Vagococcus humatus TaxID=1889241 RepID=A0A3R9YJZ5_9ENTE|nr:hydroxymethylglutaryl-CoA synthase [Vagococcus humatus]RST89511.1 hydroxymethylglutaryl-CoA synthase [Vagococcus humatus]
MTIGIDKLNFYTPNVYVDQVKLALARQEDPAKFTIGIGQEKMAINPLSQDIVSMGANAAYPILEETDLNQIDLVILATESGMDASKSGATTIHHLLNIQPFARAIEIKQACYSATAGIMMARDYVAAHPGRKALVIGSDIARYGLNTPGEVTQGAGAVAMLISEQPRILALEQASTMYTSDIYDFWRPVYSDTAFVDGKYSNQAYVHVFEQVYQKYCEDHQRTLADFSAICFHLPYSKMGKKALKVILEEVSEAKQASLLARYEESIQYTKQIGNIYTGSLYLGLCSLLDNSSQLKAGDKLGFFSYGSGAVGEFFVGKLQDGYTNHLMTNQQQELLASRHELSIPVYEELFETALVTDGSHQSVHSELDKGTFQLDYLDNHQRFYKKMEAE